MTLHELDSHRDMVTQLHDARASLQNMQILSAQQSDGMPHAHNASRSTENIAIALEAQLTRVARLERIVKRSEENGIRAWIEAIPDSRTALIFNLRYLCGMMWADVAMYVGGRNTAEAVKSVCYRYLDSENHP